MPSGVGRRETLFRNETVWLRFFFPLTRGVWYFYSNLGRNVYLDQGMIGLEKDGGRAEGGERRATGR